MHQIKRSGFTLVELVISILIAGIISLAFSAIIQGGMRNWFFIRDQKNYLAESRSVLKRMVTEIRRVKSASSADILVFTSNHLQFNDVDSTSIDYQQSGTILLRNSQTLLQNLSPTGGVSFEYLNSSGAVTSSAESIRTIKITLQVQDPDNLVKLQSAASIRNR
ncbi:MAG: type II secretion system protein [Candidatus Margulisiibacteriota bacterium]